MKPTRNLLSIFLLFLTLVVQGQEEVKPLPELQRDLINLRFGMFIHFSPTSYLDLPDQLWPDHAPPHQGKDDILGTADDISPTLFNPTKLDCGQWADAAKSAGMKFAVLTTKHHDGFCLWPSKYSNYTVAQGCKRDVVREFVDAFRKRGLKVGLYYSIRDRTAGIADKQHGGVTPEKIQLIKNQLTELLTQYGPILYIVFDGWNNTWHESPSFEDVPYAEIYYLIKSLQPNCLVLNHTTNPKFADVLHIELRAGVKLSENDKFPAVGGNTIQDTWFWRKDYPTGNLKSVDWIVNQQIIPFNKRDVVFQLNCAPNRDGLMDDNVVSRLAEVGKAWTPPAKIDSIPKSWFNWSLPELPQAKSIVLKQTNEDGIYKKGDNIKITYYSKDTKTDSIFVKIKKNFSKTEIKKFKYNGDSLVIFNEIPTEPVAYIFETNTRTEAASIGLIVEPTSFKPGTKRPKDFESFWKKEKKTLKALPMTVKSVPVNIKETEFICSDIELNCTGSVQARGYFAKPVSAKPKSLPIVIYFHWAGVNQSLPGNAMRYAKMGKGALGFDLNAHGMLDGQPNEYYDQLANGKLKDYPYIGIENRDSCYFKGMYLRLLRTIDFLTKQPEWDGKRIVVIGESQGGGQSLAAAGLDKRVTLAIVTAPAMCNWGGTLVGSKGSWPYPFESKFDRKKMLETLPYYDVAHVLKGSNATIVAELGLIDQSCPSSNVYAALNQAKGKKIILTVPYRGHHMDQPAYKEIWDNTVNKTKDEFLKDYLK